MSDLVIKWVEYFTQLLSRRLGRLIVIASTSVRIWRQLRSSVIRIDECGQPYSLAISLVHAERPAEINNMFFPMTPIHFTSRKSTSANFSRCIFNNGTEFSLVLKQCSCSQPFLYLSRHQLVQKRLRSVLVSSLYTALLVAENLLLTVYSPSFSWYTEKYSFPVNKKAILLSFPSSRREAGCNQGRTHLSFLQQISSWLEQVGKAGCWDRRWRGPLE